MSAPDTSVEKQRRRHWAPLLGMALVVLFALGYLFWWLMAEANNAPGPGSGSQIEGESNAPVLKIEPGAQAPAGSSSP